MPTSGKQNGQTPASIDAVTQQRFGPALRERFSAEQDIPQELLLLLKQIKDSERPPEKS
jgi:hypothetical protein